MSWLQISLAIALGFFGGWAASMIFRAWLLSWMFRVTTILHEHTKRIKAMATQEEQLATDVAALQATVGDLGTAIDTEVQNLQDQITVLKNNPTGGDISASLASLEGSISALQGIAAKAKAAVPPATPANPPSA